MSYQIQGRQNKTSSVSDLLMPVNGIRGAQKRAGLKPKNHMVENRMALRFAQEKAREEREMNASRKPDLYKLEQFRDVAPRVFDQVPQSPRRSARSENDGDSNLMNGGNFLTKGTANKRALELKAKNSVARKVIEEQIEDARFIANRPFTPHKDKTPHRNEYGVFAPRNDANFIEKNRKAAENMHAQSTMTQRERSKQESAVHQSFGKVPEYLQIRKAQMQREKEDEARRAPDPNCPKGMKLMPEDERTQTLDVLKSSREEAMNQLAKMPFVLETPTAKRKHAELEMKLKEIEAAIALFSKQKVYVADR